MLSRPVRALSLALIACVPPPLVLLGASALVVSGGCLYQTASFTRTFQASAPASASLGLQVQTSNGSITAHRGKDPTCVVSAKVRAISQARADAVSVSITSADGALVVRVVWPEDGRKNSEGCDLDILVPGSTWVHAASDNGAISAEGLAGVAELTTSNGQIELRNHDGPGTLTTNNGDVKASGVTGALKARSTNGSLLLNDVGGFVDGETTNGRCVVTLTGANAGPVIVQSTNGSVEVEVGAGFRGKLVAENSNGSLTLPPELAKGASKHRAELDFGAPSAAPARDSRVTTSNGDVTVRRRASN